ncbi:MAG TPA: hypothetical protein DDY91_07290 [Planctomycetaceae bacterium]|nr:hypothetical protein [Planctomycetaceae bacterium]
MSLTSLLSQTCTIRRASVSVSATGLPTATYADLTTGVRCLLQGKSGRTSGGPQGLDFAFDAVLFVPPGTDVQPGQNDGSHPDQIVIGTATYTVQAVVDRSGKANHKTCYLKGLRPVAGA